MKKILYLVLILSLSKISYSQDNGNWDTDKIKSFKIAFITKRLNLSVEEAQQFWPVYNEFDTKRDALAKEKQSIMQDLRLHFTDYSDAKIEKKIDKRVMLNRKEADLEIEYNTQFKKVLPIKKVARLYASENQFKRELIRRLRQKQQMRNNRPRNNF